MPYGLALGAALDLVSTEFVLVVQHDWLFVRDADVAAAVSAMGEDRSVKYVGMQSLTTLDYARRMRVRYGLELPPARRVGQLLLAPQLLWYDKPHLCRLDHYREVLQAANMGVCECPERKYGVELMWPILRNATDLEQEHRRFGTFFWETGSEVVYHLSGRKLHADDADASDPCARQPALAAELREAWHASATFTVAAAERTACVAGLARPRTDKEPSGRRFKGACFICGERGHSKAHCERRGAPLAASLEEIAAAAAVVR